MTIPGELASAVMRVCKRLMVKLLRISACPRAEIVSAVERPYPKGGRRAGLNRVRC